jgi:hypothetical protein
MLEKQIRFLLDKARECLRTDSPFENFDDWNRASTRMFAEIIVGMGFIDGTYRDVLGAPMLDCFDAIDRFIAAYDNVQESRPLPNTASLVREAFAQ